MSATETATRAASVVVYEMYKSVQGESTWAGLPCGFVRLAGCPLRCIWCDTEYAFTGGTRRPVDEVVAEAVAMALPLVEVTGGEPLAQPGCIDLLRGLVARGLTVLLETSGAYSIAEVPPEVRSIVDVKCPDSGEEARNVLANLDILRAHDELKFVLASRRDYEFARDMVRERGLTRRCNAVLFSPVFGKIEPRDIVQWMLDDGLNEVRFQLQLHKFIWPPEQRGV